MQCVSALYVYLPYKLDSNESNRPRPTIGRTGHGAGLGLMSTLFWLTMTERAESLRSCVTRVLRRSNTFTKEKGCVGARFLATFTLTNVGSWRRSGGRGVGETECTIEPSSPAVRPLSLFI